MIKKLQFTCRKFQDCNFDFTSIHKHHAQFYPKILAGQHTLFLYKQSPSINQIYLQSTIQGQSQNFIPVLCYFYMRPIKICTEVCGGVQTNIYIYICLENFKRTTLSSCQKSHRSAFVRITRLLLLGNWWETLYDRSITKTPLLFHKGPLQCVVQSS